MDPFIGQVMLFAGRFAPTGWAFCNGQLVTIQANPALYTIIGTTYGGDGVQTFALPDLRGRIPVHAGQGPGLSPYVPGQKGGAENVTLIQAQLPAHTHLVAPAASTSQADLSNPSGAAAAETGGRGSGLNAYTTADNAAMKEVNASVVGGSQPHDNTQPYLALSYIIATDGTFPTQS